MPGNRPSPPPLRVELTRKQLLWLRASLQDILREALVRGQDHEARMAWSLLVDLHLAMLWAENPP